MATTASGYATRAGASAAPAAFLLVALTAGVVAGIDPPVGVGVGLALAFVLLVLRDLAFGVCAFILVAFLDVVSRGADLSLTKAAGALLAAAWAASAAVRDGPRARPAMVPRPLAIALVAFLAWSALSTIWAEDPGAAMRSTARFGLDAMLVPIVFAAVRDRRHVVWVLAVFVAGALLSALWGVMHDQVTVGRPAQVGRLTGATVEANVLASLLVVSTAFAGALVTVLRRSPVRRALAAAGAVAAVTAFFATLSRGGMVALGVMILAGMVYGGRWRRAFVGLALTAGVIGIVFLGDATSDAAGRLTSANSTGRLDIWTVALRMVHAHPLAGVGSGNFTTVEPHYLIAPGAIDRPELILDTPLVAHNVYLHVLAEMGVVGLALLLAVLVLSIGSAIRAVSLFRRAGDGTLEILGRSLVVGLAGLLAADAFVSEQYSKQLWSLLALGPALLAIARAAPAAAVRAVDRGDA